MRIGILGGTGPAGSGLAARLASIGYDVVIGSRSKYRAMEARDGLVEQLARARRPADVRRQRRRRRLRRRRHRHAVGLGGDDGAGARATRSRGKVVVSMANALVRVGHEFQPLVPPRGSVAAHVQAAVPRLPRRRRVPPPAGQGARPPRRADRLRRADLRRRPRRGRRRSARSSPRSPAAARSTPASCPTRRRSRRSPPCCCSSTCATRRGSRPKLTGIKRDPRRRSRRRPTRRPVDRATVTMRLYDTARRAVVPFEPAEHVLMYTCGITPYDATHLGHAATYLAYDVLQRRLIDLGHTRDVRAQRHRRRRPAVRQGPPARRPLPRPGGRGGGPLRAPTWRRSTRCPWRRTPRASSAIPDIRGFIGMVLDRGYAYQAGGAVYFDVSKFDVVRLGQQLHRRADARASPASAVATSTTRTSATRSTSCCGSRRPPTSRRGTRCGVRAGPGWHIECSALALRELGTTIDLHGGGSRPDLPAPRVRAGPARGGDRRAVRAPLDAHGADLQGRREDVEEPRQPRVRRRPAQGVGPAGDPPRRSSSTTTAPSGSGTTS